MDPIKKGLHPTIHNKYSLCINSKVVVLRLDRGIQNPLKRLDSPIKSWNDEISNWSLWKDIK